MSPRLHQSKISFLKVQISLKFRSTRFSMASALQGRHRNPKPNLKPAPNYVRLSNVRPPRTPLASKGKKEQRTCGHNSSRATQSTAHAFPTHPKNGYVNEWYEVISPAFKISLALPS